MTNVQKVLGLNHVAVYWMDVWRFFHIEKICCKNCIVCLKRPKINEKEAVVGPFFKKKLYFFLNFLFDPTKEESNVFSIPFL